MIYLGVPTYVSPESVLRAIYLRAALKENKKQNCVPKRRIFRGSSALRIPRNCSAINCRNEPVDTSVEIVSTRTA